MASSIASSYDSSYVSGSYSRPFAVRPSTSGLSTARPGTAHTVRPRTARPRTAVSQIGGHQQIICAVTESRGVSATVGLCFVNLTTAECHLSEIQDSQTYVRTIHKLTVYDPKEILVPNTSVAPNKSTLLLIMEHYLPDTAMLQVPRKDYSEQSGHEFIRQLACADDLAGIMVAISSKFYAVSAAAAALKHITVNYTKFAMHTLRVKYQGSEGSMLIDPTTVHALELISNLNDAKSTDSLFGLLNSTQSAMGARLLRSNLLQPLTEVSTINSRLAAVEEFTQHEEMFFQVKETLKGFPDMDRLCTALVTVPVKLSLKHSEQAINNIILLKQAVKCIQPVYEALSAVGSELLLAIRSLCAPEKIEPVLNMINGVINEDVTYSKSPLDLRNQRCYAVRSGVNGLLDVARQTYKEARDDVHTLIEDLTKEHDLNLELRFEAGRGFYLRLPSSDLEDRPLPEIFVNTVKRKRFHEFTTLELMKRNLKINDCLTEVLLMSDNAVTQLVEDVTQEISGLFKVGEGIGMLDMICAFAHLCTVQDYVRPVFTETLGIKSGRHPIRERIHRDKYVPNDVYATQQTRFQIITGCNMSGKSTYLRSIALMVVMAQIGSFVPAAYASFPITLQLFARVTMDDSIEANASTFASEMRETAFILRNVSRGSLVIVDELGRGTSPQDGQAIALAVCESLIESRSLVWFATHFKSIPEILAERPGVASLHMQVEVKGGDSMTMLYKIADGTNKEEKYGLVLARAVKLPVEMVERATIVSETLEKRRELMKKRSGTYKAARKRKLLLGLVEMLKQANEGSMESWALKNWLCAVEAEFVEKMAELVEDHEEGGDDRHRHRQDDVEGDDNAEERKDEAGRGDDTTVTGTEESGEYSSSTIEGGSDDI